MRRKLPAGVVAITMVIASTAYAYILPADAILGSVAKRRAKIALKSLIVEGTIERGENSGAAVWSLLVPGKAYRVETKLDDKTIVSQTMGAKRWTYALGEKPDRPAIVKDDLVTTFLGVAEPDPGGKVGVRFAERLGIDTEVVSLSRLDGRVAYIIGAKPWEATKPQLWIDKSMRVPVRLIRQVEGGTVRDTRFLGFGSPVTGEWFPRHVEVWENGNLMRRVTYDRVKINEPVEPQLIEPPAS